MMSDVNKEVEAILFAAGRAVSLKELQALLHLRNPGLIRTAISDLMHEYASRESPLMIIEENESWKLTVKERFLPVVQQINPHTELSKTMLETLAVIAWKQPALQSDVIKIRTNKAYDHIAELDRLGFITKQKHGRSFLIKVTQKFLDYFDLPDDKSIKETFKDFKEVEVAVQSKVDDFNKDAAIESESPSEESVLSEPAGLQDSSSDPDESPAEDLSDELEPYIDVPQGKAPAHHSPTIETYDAPVPQGSVETDTGLTEEKDAEKGSSSEDISSGNSDVSEKKGEENPAHPAENKAVLLAKKILEENPALSAVTGTKHDPNDLPSEDAASPEEESSTDVSGSSPVDLKEKKDKDESEQQ